MITYFSFRFKYPWTLHSALLDADSYVFRPWVGAFNANLKELCQRRFQVRICWKYNYFAGSTFLGFVITLGQILLNISASVFAAQNFVRILVKILKKKYAEGHQKVWIGFQDRRSAPIALNWLIQLHPIYLL